MHSFKLLSWVLLLLQPCLAEIILDRLEGGRLPKRSQLQPRETTPKNNTVSCNSASCYRYYNSKTKPFLIESWPDVDFPTGEFYGGEIPIDKSNPNRSLFFIFKPAEWYPSKEVTIWLQGGPGCSSLQGFFQENGPILWQPGVSKPMENRYAWSKLTNMLWVDQPVGTGFSVGNVTATNEIDVARDFAGFFKNWEGLFDIKDYKIYVTGESYAGRYVPYISAYMLDQNDTTHFDLSGALMYDPCIGDCNLLQGVYPTYQFVLNNNEILNFNQSVLEEMEAISTNCGLTSVRIGYSTRSVEASCCGPEDCTLMADETSFVKYIEKYLQFPPPGLQPPAPKSLPKGNCDPTGPLATAFDINPCFNPDHITDYCPALPDPLSGRNAYFNRMDVKKAIHAPLNIKWEACANHNVFKNGVDSSPDSVIAALPRVIEATNRVLVSNADWDAQLYTNDTLLAIQNMTWHGVQGFQSAPSQEFVVPSIEGSPAQGVMGKMHHERGLQWVESYQSGHEQPQYQPRATWRHLQWLLGRIPNL